MKFKKLPFEWMTLVSFGFWDFTYLFILPCINKWILQYLSENALRVIIALYGFQQLSHFLDKPAKCVYLFLGVWEELYSSKK